MAKKRRKPATVIRVGIDFGTTHTIVSLADAGNYPVLTLPWDYQGEILATDHVPTAIAFHRGQAYYGPAAAACYLDHFHEGAVLVRSIKRRLQDWRQGKTIQVGGLEVLVEDLVTGFLRELRRAVLRALDLKKAEIEAVIAVPANASSSQRYITLKCFRAAGFGILRILDEPCASGIQFVHERYKRWDRVEADVIIYDLGGGTFDTTFLSIRRGRYDPKISRGISRLGGDDFDQALLTLVEDRLGRRAGESEKVNLLQRVTAVKESISPYTQKLHVDAGDQVATIPIKDFQEAVEPLLDRTIDLVELVLAEAGEGGEPPDRIVLVGGGTLLNFVPKKLRERFGRAKIHQGLYPFAAVAIGAAIQAASPDLKVLDRLNNHFGVIRVRRDGSEYVDVIFEKGLKLPDKGQVVRVACPAYDPRHNIGRFLYLECNELDPATGRAVGDPVYWNEILFPYDRALNPDGQAPSNLDASAIHETEELLGERILEEYFLDEYGIITTRISRTVQDRFTNCYNLFRRGPN